MTTINLKDFYPWYTQDEYMQVSDEAAEELGANKRRNANVCDDPLWYRWLRPDDIFLVRQRKNKNGIEKSLEVL